MTLLNNKRFYDVYDNVREKLQSRIEKVMNDF